MVYRSSVGSGGSTDSFDAQLPAVNGGRHATLYWWVLANLFNTLFRASGGLSRCSRIRLSNSSRYTYPAVRWIDGSSHEGGIASSERVGISSFAYHFEILDPAGILSRQCGAI